MPKLKLIYIAAYARSGSTVMDAMLGTHPQIEGTGELMRAGTKGREDNQMCACGRLALECNHWTDIHARWQKETGAAMEEYTALQNLFERTRSLPRLLQERRAPSAEFRRYRECTVSFLRAIRDVSGREFIADSSKYPFRAFALSLMPEIDLYLIHLIRDARGVAHSLIKPYQKDPKAGITRDIIPASAARTALLWDLVNLEIAWVRGQLPPGRGLTVRYEDFSAGPAPFLTGLGALCGLDMTPLITHMKEGNPVETRHQIAGNRVRMASGIRLRKQETWRTDLNSGRKLAVTCLSWPVLQAYGYMK